MPLLDIIDVNACQQSFYIAFAFLSGKGEEDYMWALEHLRSLYKTCNSRLPSVILTNRWLACMNAAAACFPTSTSLLCRRHANKAVLQHCRPAFRFSRQAATQEEADARDEFYQFWHKISVCPLSMSSNPQFVPVTLSLTREFPALPSALSFLSP